MKALLGLTALAVVSSSVAFAAPPAAAPPAAPVVKAAEYPLSCNAAAKPIALKAWDAMVNSQKSTARDGMKQALAADPKCVMAKAWLAWLTPGQEGRTMLDEVKGQTATLTEVEKLDLAAMVASREGDAEKAFTTAQQMVAMAPMVPQVVMTAVRHGLDAEKWPDAEKLATKATELSPKTGATWNQLGYAKLHQKKFDEAITAFKKYAEIAPTEPNAHDSLADALLFSGQLDGALAEYEKALEISGGKFATAYTGVATVKALRNDWEGARAAITREKDAVSLPNEKLETAMWTAWSYAAQGKLTEGLKALETMEKDALAAKLDGLAAWAPVKRAHLQLAAGKYADAQKTLALAEKAKIDTLSEGMKRQHRSVLLASQLEVYGRMGKVPEAEKTFAALETVMKDGMSGPMAVDTMAFSRGMVAMAKKDLKGAVEAFKGCTESFDYCTWVKSDAQDKAGDVAGASETRTALLKMNHRNPEYWFVHAQAEAMQKVPGKKVGMTPK